MAGWELPAGSSVTMTWLNLSCSQGVCAAQHRPGCHAVPAAQHMYQYTPMSIKCRTSKLCFSCLTCGIHWRQREGFPITTWRVRRTVRTNTYSSHDSVMSHKLRRLCSRSILERKIKSLCYWKLCWWLNKFVTLLLESTLTLSSDVVFREPYYGRIIFFGWYIKLWSWSFFLKM